MSFHATCPVCDAEYTLADHLRGKQMQCNSCRESFRAQDSASDGRAADAIQSSPRKAATPPRRRVVDEDDDEPRGRPRSRERDDDDDDDRPRRRRPRPDQGSSGLLIGLFVGGGVLGLAVIALVLWLVMSPVADVAVAPAGGGGVMPVGGGGVIQGKMAVPDDVIAPAGPRVRLDVKDSDIRDIVTNGPANTRAAVHSWDLAGKMKHIFHVYDVPKAALLTRLELVEPQQMDLSLDGSRLAIFSQSVDKGQLLRQVGVWSLPDGKPLVQNWSPYPDDPDFAKRRELIFLYLLSADQLLTVSRQGQFDVWDIATQKNVVSVPPIAPALSLNTNLFGHTANSFAISPDRKTLAVFNKDGFSLFDTKTGKQTGKTGAMSAGARVGNVWGVAFSPDGKSLMSYYFRFGVGQPTATIIRWSIPDGKQISLATIPLDHGHSGGLAFWGPNHVVLWNGILTEGKLHEVARGELVRTYARRHHGKCVAQPQDGKLWFATGETALGIGQLTSVEFPQQDLARFPPAPGAVRRWLLQPTGVAAGG
ncbi:MAG: WD40 repeat domain-containing protein [Gemmataceae bacterium]|nr:WD40 repeat domain-containing protein [Gemmataceae bacterium]